MGATGFDPYNLPEDIYLPVGPLIGISGLDIDNKPTHQLVWQTFTQNKKADRIALRFQLIKDGQVFPGAKQKRQSYEWYIPKGILKSNWILKYLNVIPSLMVVFCDLDWNDPKWNEKRAQICQSMQLLKTSLVGRSTRLAVVLLQTSSMPGEECGASEKAASLCATCDLPPKHLFVLPRSDAHLLGYASRLEIALNEIAGGFYLSEIKSIKSHKDFLNKTNHHILFIRHQFKLGFHNEMRNDQTTALKHYGQCYQLLHEHRITNTNLHEVRSVAAIVNYKICQLDFALNFPRDAIDQFKRHIDLFSQRTGPKELIFEHYAWLSKQHEIFAEIFREAMKNGLPSVQTQHPGFFYQKAAEHVVLRRNLAMQIGKEIAERHDEMLNGWDSLEYYGQRPWRSGKHLLEPPQTDLEAEATKAVCYEEVECVKHSELIIPLFSLAIAQFKLHRCPRIQKQLMVKMAQEYIAADNPHKALTLLNEVMWDYRTENWPVLLSSCSMMALLCSFETACISNYVSNCLEIVSRNIRVPPDQKQRVFLNLLRVIEGDDPLPEPNMTEARIASTRTLWASADSSSVPVDMDALLPCIQVRVSFGGQQFSVDQPVPITVKIRSEIEVCLQLLHVTVKTTCSQPEISEINADKLLLEPNKTLQVSLTLQPSNPDLTDKIKILGVNIGLGAWSRPIVLQWGGGGTQGATGHILRSKYKEFRMTADEFDDEVVTEVEILSRSPLMELHLEFDENALVWEWLPIRVSLKNLERSTADQVQLSLSLDHSPGSSYQQTTQISTRCNLESKLSLPSVSQLNVGDLNEAQETSQILFIKALTAAKRNFKLEMQYTSFVEKLGKKVVFPSYAVRKFSVNTKLPFQINITTESLQFESISQVSKSEKFVVVPKISCSSHVPITFVQSSVVPASGVKLCGETTSQVIGVELEQNDEATDCFPLVFSTDLCKTTDVPLGQYMLYWKRSVGDSPTVSVSFGLPTISIEECGMWVDTRLPSNGRVRVPMTVAYDIKNTSDCLKEIVISMQVSDAFMFSGHKEARLRILPGWFETVTYTLYPLMAGYVQLPRLCIEADVQTSTPVNQLLSRILPSHIFVMPQAKCSAAEKDNRVTITAS